MGAGSWNRPMVKYPAQLATSRGARKSIVSAPRTISLTNRPPARGVWKAEDMPEAAAQATTRRRRGAERWKKRPRAEPATAAACTSGPSRPMDAPEPTEKTADRERRRLGLGGTYPLPSATASMYSVALAGTKRWVKRSVSPAKRPPAAGTKMHQAGSWLAIS